MKGMNFLNLPEKNPEGRLVLFKSKDGDISLPVSLDGESVWLSQAQMALLFGKDRTVIGRHIKNAIEEGEIEPEKACAKFAHTTRHGALPNLKQRKEVTLYNLDVIISVGYRVHSLRGVEFRRWATSVLKDYILRGCALDRRRLAQLGETVQLMERVAARLDVEQVLDVVSAYSSALDLLDAYDHQSVGKPVSSTSSHRLSYEECRLFIARMKYADSSELFGREKDNAFKSALGAIYQTFAGRDLYPSAEEKAANLLYLTTKNHGFVDGNKRIAAGLFLYFLERQRLLLRADGSKRVADHTLVALTVMIAESKPSEKEMMVNLVMNFLL